MRKFLLIASIAVLLGVVLIYMAGGFLSAPQQHSVGDPPDDWAAEKVLLPKLDGNEVSGWFAQGRRSDAAILLLHSVRSDRREMMGRAEFLLAAGYSVFLIDMQAHGETLGKQITFGHRESEDVHTALNFLRGKPGIRKVGVIAVSLGGAAALLGKSPVDADAVILEAVYSSIEQAVKNRLSIRLGDIGGVLSPLLTWQIGPRLSLTTEELSPLDAIERLKSPVLIIAGDEDRHTLLEESQRLYQQAGEPKQLWVVEGASHQNFHLFAQEEYEKRVLAFFQRYLSGGE